MMRIEAARTQLLDYLSRIIYSFDCQNSPSYFQKVRQLLDSLPLSAAESGLARSRIDNAQRYADAAESGAAVYELNKLHGKLRSYQW